MKRIMVVLVLATLLLGSNLGAADLYKIEQLGQGLFRITAVAQTCGDYGDSIAMGIKSLTSKYRVEEIIILTYDHVSKCYAAKDVLIRVSILLR